jgi:hypothetical protein
MTADKPSHTVNWDDLIEYAHEELAPDARTEAIKAAIAPSLTAFERHKEELLDILRNADKRGPKSEPFDAENAWSSLTSLAESYFWLTRTKQEVTRSPERAARLRELATALGNARAMIDKVMQDDVGDALRASWWEGTSEFTKARRFFLGFFYMYANGRGRFVDIERKFKKVVEKEVARLGALEAAAIRAADDVPTTLGRPKGTAILSWGDIEGLAAVYRSTTGSKPGAGDGPFAKFVMEFLTALGRRNIKDESVISAIKEARRWALKRPAADRWGPSPFDEEFERKSMRENPS